MVLSLLQYLQYLSPAAVQVVDAIGCKCDARAPSPGIPLVQPQVGHESPVCLPYQQATLHQQSLMSPMGVIVALACSAMAGRSTAPSDTTPASSNAVAAPVPSIPSKRWSLASSLATCPLCSDSMAQSYR